MRGRRIAQRKGRRMTGTKNGRRAGETLTPTSSSGRPSGKTKNCIYSSKTTRSFPLNIHSIRTTISLRNYWDSPHHALPLRLRQHKKLKSPKSPFFYLIFTL